MGLFSRMSEALDPDRLLQAVVSSLIEAQAVRHGLDLERQDWRPGDPLKLLLAGYVGSRNTGADVRVEEMIRQFRHIIGDDDLELTIMTTDRAGTAGYFNAVRQVEIPQVFPKFLFDECRRHHGVVACEGSMFKSKFASALTTMMAGSLGMANAENKLSVGYGAEAGHMTRSLQEFVRRHCRDSLVLCRNEPSREVLGSLGIRTRGGTDTAWTFEPAPLERGAGLLRDRGWDGAQKILVLCPINPFWWPVKPDIPKTLALHLGGQYRQEHYRSIYFHEWSEQSEEKYDNYISAIATAVNRFRRDKNVFTILVGMEKLDRKACDAVASRLERPGPLFVSDEYDMYDLVSVLRNCGMMLSSRFHAIVTSMPGLVPSAGITMDERIRNLMNDRGTPELFMEVDEDDLTDKIFRVLGTLDREADKVSADIGRALPHQLRLMGQMGIDFLDEVSRVYPEFPRRDVPRSWDHHLPPLSFALNQVLERYA